MVTKRTRKTVPHCDHIWQTICTSLLKTGVLRIHALLANWNLYDIFISCDAKITQECSQVLIYLSPE